MSLFALSENINEISFHAQDLGCHEVRLESGFVINRHYLLFRFNGMVEMEDLTRVIGEFGFRHADNSDLIITMKKKVTDTIRASEARSGSVATYDSRGKGLERILVLSVPMEGKQPEFFSVPSFPRQVGWTFLVCR